MFFLLFLALVTMTLILVTPQIILNSISMQAPYIIVTNLCWNWLILTQVIKRKPKFDANCLLARMPNDIHQSNNQIFKNLVKTVLYYGHSLTEGFIVCMGF